MTISGLSSLVCRYYDAVIDMLSEDGETCTVTFDGYGTTVIVKVCILTRVSFVELLVSFSHFFHFLILISRWRRPGNEARSHPDDVNLSVAGG